MADLSALIRLNKHELDEKRRVLGALYEQLALLERERRELERAFELEKAAVDAVGDVHFTFAKYAEKVRLQQNGIDRRVSGLETQIEAAKESLMETFSELKKYETAEAERLAVEEETRRQNEGKEMDEIGLETFRRREDG